MTAAAVVYDRDASSSWIGFANATDRQKVQSFVNRSKRSGFFAIMNSKTLTLCVLHPMNGYLIQFWTDLISDHVLHPLLSPHNAFKYQLRSRPHNRQLSQRTSRLTDCNFIVRLYRFVICIDSLSYRPDLLYVYVLYWNAFSVISFIKLLIDWLIEDVVAESTSTSRIRSERG